MRAGDVMSKSNLLLQSQNRRFILQTAAILTATQIFNNGANAMTQPPMPPQPPAPPSAPNAPLPPIGKIGEFKFLAGEWKIQHRKLKTGSTTEWVETEGTATCFDILGGFGSVEELRIPSWNFSGMGLRLLDVEKKVWQDFWVNSRNGVMGTEPTLGVFIDNIGTFDSIYQEGDKEMISRGVWDRITPNSHRWYQTNSSDGGKTWDLNWTMDWTRA